MRTIEQLNRNTASPTADQLASGRERGFTADSENPSFAELDGLKAKLLGIGGWAVVLLNEPDLDKILNQGVLLDGEGVAFADGAKSGCHANSAVLHLGDPKRNAIMTGYALSEDGMWRQHSWVFDTQADTIIETTEARVAYFGVLLSEVDALVFCTRNVPFSPEAKALVDAHPAYADFLALVKSENV